MANGSSCYSKVLLKRNRHIPMPVFYFLLLFTLVSCKPRPEYRSLPENVQLRSGDLAFRLGNSIESAAVVTADRSTTFSHVGIVVFTDNDWHIVHAVPGEAEKGAQDTMKMDTIPLFFRSDRARKCAIYRLPVPDSIAGKAAMSALGFYQRRLLFDAAFNLEDTTQMYCTELIYHAYRQYGIDVSGGRRHTVPGFPFPMVWPSDLLKSNRLELIWYSE